MHLSYICKRPKSKQMIALTLILSKWAPKHSIEDLKANAGPTLQQH